MPSESKPVDWRAIQRLVGRAVVVCFKDKDADWRYYRVERADRTTVCFTGMADDEGNPHNGCWVRARLDELKSVVERK